MHSCHIPRKTYVPILITQCALTCFTVLGAGAAGAGAVLEAALERHKFSYSDDNYILQKFIVYSFWVL
jgi:hypothetical protein